MTSEGMEAVSMISPQSQIGLTILNTSVDVDDNPIIQIQPRPTLTRVAHFGIFRWWVTAVMRHWNPGDSGPSGRCKLCPKCKAHHDGCLMIVSGKVDPEDADMLSIVRRVIG